MLNALPAARGAPSPPAFSVGLSATPTSGSVPLLVSFQTTVLSGIPSAFNWSFGDGNFLNATPGTGADPYHTYARTGSFDAVVVVHEEGAPTTATANVTITVTSASLQATASATPTSGTAPLTILFTASATGGTGTYDSFRWTFGDGGEGTGASLYYTYDRAGTFRAVVNVTDEDGHWSTATVVVTVNAPGSSGVSGSSWALLAVVLVLGFVAGISAILLLGWWGRKRRRPEPGPPPEAATEGTVGTPPPDAMAPNPEGAAPEEPVSATPPIEPAPAPSVPSAQASGETSRGQPPPPVTPSSPSETMAHGASWASSGALAPDHLQGAKAHPVAAPPAPAPEALKISERVVLHLASQGLLHDDEVAPDAFTQAGMASAISIRQNALTNVLRRLEAAGILTVDVRHVTGRDRRMKVYRLSARGEALARELRSRSASGAPRAKGP